MLLPATSAPSPDYLADALDRSAAASDVFATLGYTPTPKQQEFHAAAEWDVLYGGAAGGGKTIALLMHAIRACMRYPDLRVLATRRTYQELRESFLDELLKVGNCQALGARYNAQDHDLTFPNGSLIRFRYCSNLADARLRLGSAIQLLIVDEATGLDADALDFLAQRIRSSKKHIPTIGVRLGTNPGGASHAFFRERYVEATDHGRRAYEDVVDEVSTGHMVRFIPARLDDNPYLSETDYQNTLKGIRDPQLRKAMREGSWDLFDGQVFTSWRHDKHVVEPFDVPPVWRRHCGIDWGFRSPFAAVWLAEDGDGRLWVYRELKAAEWTAKQQAQRILAEDEASRDWTVTYWRDPSTTARMGTGTSVADEWRAAGLSAINANNDRLAGWGKLHDYLADAPACPIHRFYGRNTCPLLHVFAGCTNVIKDLPALVYAKTGNPEDVDTHGDDHVPDALRYAMTGIGGSVSAPLLVTGRAGRSRYDYDIAARQVSDQANLLRVEF